MYYKIPDMNKIKMLSPTIIKNWDSGRNLFLQTLHPTSEFGINLPIKDGESAVYHCLNGGDVFLALATRLDCDWIASDIRSSSTEHVKNKADDAQFRLEAIANNVYWEEYYRSGSLETAQAAKDTIKENLKELIVKEGKILQKRKIQYIAGDSNYLGLPAKSVDWNFSYEPVFLWEPTVLIEMLASARKGAIFAFSKNNAPSANALRNPDKDDFSFFYKTALIYGSKIKIFHKTEKALDDEEQEVGYAIIRSTSDLPVIDRKVIKYCAESIFPEQKIPGISTVGYEVDQLSRGPFSFDLQCARHELGLSGEQVWDSMDRVSEIMKIEGCDCKYSIASLFI